MSDLTPRERELASLVAIGQSNKQIADTLGICQQTVKNHVRSIYMKLDVTNRVQLTLYLSKHPDETSPVVGNGEQIKDTQTPEHLDSH
jgi:DNA-binding NarL/FixJ family response regulator